MSCKAFFCMIILISVSTVDSIDAMHKAAEQVAKLKVFISKHRDLKKLYELMLRKGSGVPTFFDYLIVKTYASNYTLMLPIDSALKKIPLAARKKMNGDVKALGDLLRYYILYPQLDGKALTKAAVGTRYTTFYYSWPIFKQPVTNKGVVKLGPQKAKPSNIATLTLNQFYGKYFVVHFLDTYIIPPNYT